MIYIEKTEFHSLLNYDEYPLREMEKRSEEFYLEMKKRRTVRQLSDRPIPRIIIKNCIRILIKSNCFSLKKIFLHDIIKENSG